MDIKKNTIYIIILALVGAADISILLDVPFFRPLGATLLLVIIPIVIFITACNIIDPRSSHLCLIKILILCFGSTLCFLLILGLLTNTLFVSLGIINVFSTNIILPIINATLGIFLAFTYLFQRKGSYTIAVREIFFSCKERKYLIIPFVALIMSVFGTYVMNTYQSNFLLCSLILLVSIYIAYMCFRLDDLPENLVSIILYLLSLSLILILALRTNHIIGIDVHKEYHLFNLLVGSGTWEIVGGSRLNACLSITLLPLLLQSLSGIQPELLFKVLYPIIYAVAPVCVFLLAKKYLNNTYAFLSACFFMTQFNFLWTTANARTNLAILGFLLILLAIFDNTIQLTLKKIFTILFLFLLVTSHYSTTYIVYGIIVATYLSMEILTRKFQIKSKRVDILILLIFSTLIFFWYSQVVTGTYAGGVSFVEDVVIQMSDLFSLDARGNDVQMILGQSILSKSVPEIFNFIVTWVTFFMIGIGVISICAKYRSELDINVSTNESRGSEFGLASKIDVEYYVLALCCSILLIITILLPYIAVGYGVDRIYAVTTTILSSFFVIGGIAIVRGIRYVLNVTKVSRRNNSSCQNKHLTYSVILLVILLYFICSSGFIFTLFGMPKTIALNNEGSEYDKMNVYDQDQVSAHWLGQYNHIELTISTDHFGILRLVGYGSMSLENMDEMSMRDSSIPLDGRYIYLRYANVKENKVQWSDMSANTSSVLPHVLDTDRIYNNGAMVLLTH